MAPCGSRLHSQGLQTRGFKLCIVTRTPETLENAVVLYSRITEFKKLEQSPEMNVTTFQVSEVQPHEVQVARARRCGLGPFHCPLASGCWLPSLQQMTPQSQSCCRLVFPDTVRLGAGGITFSFSNQLYIESVSQF